MKTKQILSIAVMILFCLVCVNNVNAQTPSNTDQVKVNIKFKPIQTLVVNPGQKTVDLVYSTKDNYQNGVSSDQADHLTVFSTGGFQVNVKSDGAFKHANASEIKASDVKILASYGTGTNIGDFTVESLSTGDTPIISAAKGGNELNYNIKYDNTAAGANFSYINQYIHSETESVYSANVTYTIVSK